MCEGWLTPEHSGCERQCGLAFLLMDWVLATLQGSRVESEFYFKPSATLSPEITLSPLCKDDRGDLL